MSLRSRRARIAVTVVSVLFVGGLIVMNWNRNSSGSSDGLAEMDLSEFNSVSGLDEPRIGGTSEPQPLGVISDAESMPRTERLPPLEWISHADHETLRGPTASGVVPATASFGGTRGAVLTGQIEFEAPSRLADDSAGRFRKLGMR